LSEPREDATKPEVGRTPWIQRSRLARIWLPVAASALVVVGLAIWRGQNRPPIQGGRLPGGGEGMRGGVPALVLLEPVGPIADSPRQFRWTRDPGAASYRVELFDQDAKRIGVAVTADTTLAIETLSRQPINAGQWRVVPLGANGLELPRHVRAVFVVAR
jgi:hypothetical protein